MLGRTEFAKVSPAELAYREFFEANEDVITPEESEYWLESVGDYLTRSPSQNPQQRLIPVEIFEKGNK